MRRSGVVVAPRAPSANGADSTARGQSRCSSPGGPGRTTTTQLPASSTTPGAVPAIPSEIAPSGSVACLRTPGRSRHRGGASALRTAARSARSRPRAPRRPRALGPRRARRARSSCRRGSARGHPRRGRRRPRTFAQRRLQLVRVVADDRDPRRLETEPEGLLRIERAVEVGSLAAHELAARDDDRGARALEEGGGIFRCPFFGTATRTPATRTTTLRGRGERQRELASSRTASSGRARACHGRAASRRRTPSAPP